MTSSVRANLQLIFVSDIERSTALYKKLFQAEPIFTSPRYVAFSAGAEALFALWTGGETPDPQAQRYSEIGIMLPNQEDVAKLFEQWQNIPDLSVLREPYTEVFGLTFLVRDPDGHVIRVSPLD